MTTTLNQVQFVYGRASTYKVKVDVTLVGNGQKCLGTR